MKLSVRLISSMLALLLIACCFAGCGKKKASDVLDGTEYISSEETIDGEVLKPNEEESTASETEESVAEGETPPDVVVNTDLTSPQEKRFESLKGTTFRVMVGSEKISPDTQRFWNVLIKKYGIKIEPVVLGWQEAQSKLAQMVAAGSPPDVAHISDVLAMRYVYSNIAQPMDQYIETSDPAWKKSDLDALKVNGKTYGLPVNVYSDYYVYYNKNLFKEYRQKEPYEYYKEGNWNFNTFLEVAKNMTRFEADGKTKKLTAVGTWNYSVFMLANGATGITADGRGGYKNTIDQPKEMAGLKMISDLAKAGALFNNTEESYAAFRLRKIAMLIERPMNAIGQYDYYNQMEDKIGMAPLPKGPNVDKYYVPMTYDGFFIPRNAKNPLAAVAYMYE
ncbi:MAG: extracellular solute-binding protein, partial [Oscillospiraceae bacterium]